MSIVIVYSNKRISNIDMSVIVEKCHRNQKKDFFFFHGFNMTIILIGKYKMQLFFTFQTIIKFIYFEGMVHIEEEKMFDCVFGFTEIFDSEINNVIRIKLIVVFLFDEMCTTSTNVTINS